MLKFHNPVLNILISYAYFKADMMKRIVSSKIDYQLVLDSGAFTVWKKGKTISVQEYCDFIKSLPLKPWRYFNLDVIGNPEKTLKNYEYMLSEGLTPIPIFTRGEDYDMIEHYYKTSEVVGIGGLVSTKNKNNVVKKVMRITGDRKVHWLGFTNMSYIKHYRPYMCDSSSWSSVARFASGRLYLGNGKDIGFNKSTFQSKPDPVVLKGLTDLGFDPQEFAFKKNWKADYLFRIGFASEIRRSLEVKEKLGTNLFLACCSISDIEHALTQFTKLTGFNK